MKYIISLDKIKNRQLNRINIRNLVSIFFYCFHINPIEINVCIDYFSPIG